MTSKSGAVILFCQFQLILDLYSKSLLLYLHHPVILLRHARSRSRATKVSTKIPSDKEKKRKVIVVDNGGMHFRRVIRRLGAVP